MALPLGKITIIIGTGIATTVLAKEGRLSDVSDYLSRFCKIMFMQIANGDSKQSTSKPKNDALMAQINSMRQELQSLSSVKTVTIINPTGSSPKRYGVLIVATCVGYGYIRWKGWKLPDWRIATKRSLSDACNTVSKQLEYVYNSIAITKRHLSGRLDKVDSSLDECAHLTSATREEISGLHGETSLIKDDVQSVRGILQSLMSRLMRIEGTQDSINDGVKKLIAFTRNLEKRPDKMCIEGSSSNLSRPAPSRLCSGSLPPIAAAESQPPTSSSGFAQILRRPVEKSADSGLGLRGLYDFSAFEASIGSKVSDKVVSTKEIPTDHGSVATATSTPPMFSRRFGIGGSILTRAKMLYNNPNTLQN